MNAEMSTGSARQVRLSRPEPQYRVVLENLYDPDMGKYSTYGIQVTTCGRTDILHDVSLSESTVNTMVDRINRYRLSHIHLYDVVSDMLP